jgi:hypothetical protein
MRSLAKSSTFAQTDTLNSRLAPNRYEIVVGLTAAVHFAFIGYVATGGLFALRWRRSFWLHVPAGLWATTWIVAHQPCPLNKLEHWARAKAGMPALPPNGFIGHYIDGVIYPARWKSAVELVAFSMVVVPWALYAWHGLRRNASGQRADRAARQAR